MVEQGNVYALLGIIMYLLNLFANPVVLFVLNVRELARLVLLLQNFSISDINQIICNTTGTYRENIPPSCPCMQGFFSTGELIC